MNTVTFIQASYIDKSSLTFPLDGAQVNYNHNSLVAVGRAHPLQCCMFACTPSNTETHALAKTFPWVLFTAVLVWSMGGKGVGGGGGMGGLGSLGSLAKSLEVE